MDWPLIFDGLSAAGAIVTAIGVLVGFRHFKKQMNAQTFLTYTERYERIMNELPSGARLGRFDAEASIWATNPDVQAKFLQYFNLCSEEYYLYINGYLDARLWAVWEDEMRKMARSATGRAVWHHVRHEFDSFAQFRRWLEEAQNDSQTTTV